MSEGRNLNIPVVAVGAIVMWTVALGLLSWDTVMPEDIMLARTWALMVGIAAAAWTVIAGTVCVARRTANNIVRRVALHEEARTLTKI